MNASQNPEILQMTGPGYFARGCQDERRYSTMDVVRVIQNVANVVTLAERSEWAEGGQRYVNAAGKPMSSAMWSGWCVSLRLKMRWVNWKGQQGGGSLIVG